MPIILRDPSESESSFAPSTSAARMAGAQCPKPCSCSQVCTCPTDHCEADKSLSLSLAMVLRVADDLEESWKKMFMNTIENGISLRWQDTKKREK